MIFQFHVDGDIAIVTDASQRIGEAIAKKFADNDVNVAICSRFRERFQHVVNDIERAGGSVCAAKCNRTDEGRVFEFVDEVMARFGDINVLINSTDGSFQSPFGKLSENAWKTISQTR